MGDVGSVEARGGSFGFSHVYHGFSILDPHESHEMMGFNLGDNEILVLLV